MLRLGAKSITGKLTTMNVLVSAGALLVCCVAFVSYDIYSYRDALLRNLSIQAQIIGFNCISAITFNDPGSAQSTLSAVSVSPNIIAAGILLPDGQMFARYARSGVPVSLPPTSHFDTEQYWFRIHEVILVRPIDFQGKIIGAVYIRANPSTLYARLARYLLITVVVVVASLIAAFVLSRVFRRSISDPVIGLAETARVVSREKNFSLRATPSSEHDELSTLVAAFNEMLAEIQERDEELRKAHGELEQRVEERTRQLLIANRQLEQRTRELVFANKELEAFSYSVSHDL
ncbi:MAG: HAMP domain-containing protein, partial [Acidobacteria bacterium]|nr:HAMP domain-containing protein [Acidobacteriota bacterium]